MPRPGKDEYFMGIAEAVSKRATCVRHNFGAVIVQNDWVVGTGYNGAPKGMQHCLDIGCLRDRLNIPSGTQQQKCRGVHAEQNALLQASSHGANMNGATIHVNGRPCVICSKMIINAGITRVVYSGTYPDPLGEEMLREAGVMLTILK